MVKIEICDSEVKVRACFPVMRELRLGLEEAQFVAAVARMSSTQSYLLAALYEDGVVRAVMGFRRGESLACGRYVYVDDLVTAAEVRSRGFGKALLDFAADHAKQNGCAELHLDSGVQRFAAHRFYLRERMDIVFHHFRRVLDQ